MRASLLTGLALLIAAAAVAAEGPATTTSKPSTTAASEKAAAADKWIAPQPMAPTLNVVEVDAGDKKAPAGAVTLDKLDIQVAIAGPMAETIVTLTFKNTLDRNFQGELEFPLPEGVAVSGYGLDVGGTMVDGVPVEKMRARQIYESELRKGVDPGILEQTKGNSFKTRISPIPAKGTRMAKIKFISPLAQLGGIAGAEMKNFEVYSLPLAIPGKLSDANVRVEVAGKNIKPTIAGLEGLAFVQDGNKVVASKEFHNVELKGTLQVSVPADLFGTQVYVERREKLLSAIDIEKKIDRSKDERSEFHFMAAVGPVTPLPRPPVPPMRLHNIAIYWDASLSRDKADKASELALLKELATQQKDLHIDVVPFSNTIQKPASFAIKNGDSAALIKYLEGLVYDGATDLSMLKFSHDPGSIGLPSDKAFVYDAALLFTDGISTIGSGLPAKAKLPVITICGGTSADFVALQRIAADSAGGTFLNLQRIKPKEAAEAIRSSVDREFVTVSFDETKIADVYPRGQQPAFSPLTLVGKLLAAEATIVLNYSDGQKKEITLKRAEAFDGDLVSRYWANQKVADLSATPVGGDEILAIGKEFGIVTPNTSLMVLETVEQYVQYGIVPPKSHPALYKSFAEKIEARGVENAKAEAAKIDRVLAMWKQRVEWWEKDFSKVVVKLDKGDQKKAGFASTGPDGIANNTSDLSVDGSGGEQLGGNQQASRQLAGQAAASPARPAMPADPSHPSGVASTQPNGYFLQSSGPDRIYGIAGKDGEEKNRSGQATIKIKEYDAKKPYIEAIKGSKKDSGYSVFIEQRKTFGTNPGFYLDCAEFFRLGNEREIAIRILTDIAELKLEDAPLLRVAAYRLMQIGEYELALDLFEKAKMLRPDEPQSWRDLAVVHAEMGELMYDDGHSADLAAENLRRNIEHFQEAIDCYHHVVMNKWERFDEIEVIALMEANELWEQIQRFEGDNKVAKTMGVKNPFDARLIKNLACDLRIVMTWDADMTDIDLHVSEPTGETANYSYNRTQAGGLVSRDFTQGYGPEEYCIKAARPGKYMIKANYFGSNQQAITGPVTVQATVITHFGKPDENRQSMTLRLTEAKEMQLIGEVTIGKE